MSEYFFTKKGNGYDIFEKKEGQKIDRVANIDIGNGALLWDKEQWDGFMEVIGQISENALRRKASLGKGCPDDSFDEF